MAYIRINVHIRALKFHMQKWAPDLQMQHKVETSVMQTSSWFEVAGISPFAAYAAFLRKIASLATIRLT